MKLHVDVDHFEQLLKHLSRCKRLSRTFEAESGGQTEFASRVHVEHAAVSAEQKESHATSPDLSGSCFASGLGGRFVRRAGISSYTLPNAAKVRWKNPQQQNRESADRQTSCSYLLTLQKPKKFHGLCFTRCN